MGGIEMSKFEEFQEMSAYEDREDLNEDFHSVSIDVLVDYVESYQDVILFGPPGTGKTFLINKLEEQLANRVGKLKKIQFHSNYSYEDFIEGIVPKEEGEGFTYRDGHLLEFINEINEYETKNPKDKIHILMIDEINRADITSVFGEVMNVIEDKGLRSIQTAKTKKQVTIPANLVVIGTMNTSDRTLARMDMALRRRFKFLPVYPSRTILHKLLAEIQFETDLEFTIEDYVKVFNNINYKISHNSIYGKELTLGHMLWVPNKNDDNPYSLHEISENFRTLVFPQIESFARGDKEFIQSVIGIKIAQNIIYGNFISDDDINRMVISNRHDQTYYVEDSNEN